MGGSFDPVHEGHLRAAREVAKRLALDKMVFVPAKVSPHKRGHEGTAAFHRFEMLRLAVEDDTLFGVSDMELLREAPSYTVDTLRIMKRSSPDDELYFVLGAEIFSGIDTWKDFGGMLGLANFVVVNRPGFSRKAPRDLIPLALRDRFQYLYGKEGMEVFTHESCGRLFFLDIEGVEVSSTEVRKLVRSGGSPDELVPDRVRRYIARNGLYRMEEGL